MGPKEQGPLWGSSQRILRMKTAHPHPQSLQAATRLITFNWTPSWRTETNGNGESWTVGSAYSVRFNFINTAACVADDGLTSDFQSGLVRHAWPCTLLKRGEGWARTTV